MSVLASDLRMKSAAMSFVTAGNCQIDGLERSGLIQLGRVPADALAALYSLAVFVVVPLLSGTGTSLKVIEAMGYGKVVIGTGIAFRGIPVSDGVEAIVVDRVEQIADKINGLRGNCAGLQKSVSVPGNLPASMTCGRCLNRIW